MVIWEGYIIIEDVALTAPQSAAILAAFKALGPVTANNPSWINHRRISLNNKKVIYQARFNVANLTIEKVKTFLANAVGVPPAIIADSTQQTAFGPVITYTVTGIDRMRFLVCAGLGSTWKESHVQVINYIDTNRSEWESVE